MIVPNSLLSYVQAMKKYLKLLQMGVVGFHGFGELFSKNLASSQEEDEN